MDDMYYDVSHPASYGGVEGLRKATGKPLKEVNRWLKGQRAYSLHKPVRVRNIPRTKTISGGINDLMQADLISMEKLSKYNDRNKFILTVIDVFSKVAHAVPIKNKTGSVVCNALEKIIANDPPSRMVTDDGKEFFNKNVQDLFKKNNVLHYSTKSGTKAAVVERFNRTLLTRLSRYMTHKSTKRYVDVLQDFVNSYNNRFHRTIKMAPNEVNVHNAKTVWERVYLPWKKPVRFKFQIGERVRISRIKGLFEKGYKTNWSEEYFIIRDQLPKYVPAYRLEDLSGQLLDGIFYEEELQSITEPEKYHIDKIIRWKTVKGKKLALVQWSGWPSSFNSWVEEGDIVK